MIQQMSIFGGFETVKSFEQDAYGFLVAYAKRMRGESFCSEDVTLAAKEAGIAPRDLRAWGSIFTQAARDGYIRRSERLFSRSMGNGSLAPGWVGL